MLDDLRGSVDTSLRMFTLREVTVTEDVDVDRKLDWLTVSNDVLPWKLRLSLGRKDAIAFFFLSPSFRCCFEKDAWLSVPD